MSKRIVHTVEALQALEAAVAKKGRDYIEPGDPNPDNFGSHWFAYLDGNEQYSEYGCLLGHWMGELGLTTKQAGAGTMPNLWHIYPIAGKGAEVYVSPEVREMLRDVPTENDEGHTWGAIIDRIRARAIINEPDLDLSAVPVVERMDHEHVL